MLGNRWLILGLAAVSVVACNKADEKVVSNSNTATPPTKQEWPANQLKGNEPEAPAPSTNTPAPDPTKSPDANNTASGNGEVLIDGKTVPKVTVPAKMNDVEKPGTKNWTADKIAPEKLAAEVDEKIHSLRDSKMHFEMIAKLPEGSGTVNLDSIIADNDHYLVRYAKFLKASQPYFESYTVTRLEGGKGPYATLVNGKYVEGRVPPNTDVLTGWVTDSTHYLTSALGSKNAPISDLVAAAKKAKWTVKAETKTFAAGTFQRIVMESPDGGKRRYDILIEPKRKLPVTFNADIDGKKKTQVTLTIATVFNTQHLGPDDLKPGIKTDKINVLTPEEANKVGIYVPGVSKKKDGTEIPKKGGA